MKMFLASPNDQKYPHYPLVLKCNVTLAWPLRFVIPSFFLNGNSCQMFDACIFMTSNETDVDGLTHTKQLLNLLCIVYQTINHSFESWRTERAS